MSTANLLALYQALAELKTGVPLEEINLNLMVGTCTSDHVLGAWDINRAFDLKSREAALVAVQQAIKLEEEQQ